MKTLKKKSSNPIKKLEADEFDEINEIEDNFNIDDNINKIKIDPIKVQNNIDDLKPDETSKPQKIVEKNEDNHIIHPAKDKILINEDVNQNHAIENHNLIKGENKEINNINHREETNLNEEKIKDLKEDIEKNKENHIDKQGISKDENVNHANDYIGINQYDQKAHSNQKLLEVNDHIKNSGNEEKN